ncbi:hypothetical protein AcW1_001576 [Taiwanofungus camphoratus]|nr:hypothetical protein AcV7_003576 [Antrodia cinnamomea]KAI0938776.1 hypothetical protein AcV5_000383 [Antrodia cinnamomea]KAI0945330.1 hypothetical protein AcW1_001576 [Antrodia cinnamomea]
MDYCPGGDFLKFLSERRDMCGNDALVKMFLFQILDAVETCHEMGIFHRDIKPENILCSADGTQLYLSDFGLSTRKPDSLRFGAGSSYFMSPECIGSDVRQKAYSTRANDVWALGVIMVNMITGRNPWRKATMADECYRAYIHDPNFLQNMLPISCDANVILQQVFAANPLYRISLSHLRAMILQIDTFFMTRKEIAGANSHVRKAAETYYGTSECLMLHEKTSPKQSHGAFTAYSLDKHAVEIGEKSLLVLAPFGPPFSDGEDICRVPRSYPTNTALKETSAPSDVESDGPMTPDESPSRSFLTIPSFPGGAKAARSLATQVSSYSKRSGISLSSGFIRRAIEKLHLR